MRGYPRNRLTDRSGADPVVTKTTHSRGHVISYDDAGEGPVIVLIPGSTMSAADWRDAGYVDILAADHRVLSVDPLGSGLSDKSHRPDDYRWPGVAVDVMAVLDAEGIERAVFWGYSRGAALAGSVAATFPERVTGLIMCGGTDLTEDLKASAPSAMTEAMLNGDFGPLWEAFSSSAEDRAHDAEVNDPTALGAMSLGLNRSGFGFDVGSIQAPALAMCGTNDEPEEPRRTAAAMGINLYELADLDHLESFTRLDVVMPIVTGFLEPLGL